METLNKKDLKKVQGGTNWGQVTELPTGGELHDTCIYCGKEHVLDYEDGVLHWISDEERRYYRRH